MRNGWGEGDDDMADLYLTRCDSCGREMSVSIDNACVERKTVHAFCPNPDCQIAWEQLVEHVEASGVVCVIFPDKDFPGCTVVSTDKQAYGIHVNGLGEDPAKSRQRSKKG